MEQQTDKWLEWRKGGIGSSDAPIIMGVSKFKTPRGLWREKTGIGQDQDVEKKSGDFIKFKGHKFEDIARAKTEIELGIDLNPAVVEWQGDQRIRASLDGWNADANICWETKLLGKNDFEFVQEKKKPPAHYWPQVQHQLIVTGAKHCIFNGIRENPDFKSIEETPGIPEFLTVSIEVKPDRSYCIELLQKELEFLEMIEKKIEPPETDRDIVKIKDQGLRKLVSEFAKNQKKADEYKQKADELKKQIAEKMEHSKMATTKFKLQMISRSGSIQWKKVAESLPGFKDIDLTKFKGKDSTYLDIKPIKKEQ